MAIALPAADARVDEPLGHGSRGSARAAALEQLALQPDDLRGSEEWHKVSHGTRRRIISRSGEGCGSTGMAAHLKIIDMDEVRSTDAVGDRPRHRE